MIARTGAFDRAILAADDHRWHPFHKADIDFSLPFDMTTQPLLADSIVVALAAPYVSDHLDREGLRTAFVNEVALRYFSSILHGEQMALGFAAALCLRVDDLGAKEYAANQAREEARHVTAFNLYIQSRWGAPSAPNPVFEAFLPEVLESRQEWKLVIGMQVLVESMAMGIFSALHDNINDDVGRMLVRLVSVDESFHLRAGHIFIDQVLSTASDQDRAEMEIWTARSFRRLSLGLFAPQQQKDLYLKFGLEPERVAKDLRRLRPGPMPTAADAIFRTVAKAIGRAGLIGAKTKNAYRSYL